MRKIRAIACLAIALASGSAAAASDTPCNDQITFRNKAELPEGLLVALAFDMADAGEPFQETDTIAPGRQLPFRRFISAQQIGCDLLALSYERGGRGYSRETALFDRVGDRWILRSPR